LQSWTKETVSSFVDSYLKVRFPTVIALNKIDLPASDKNIDRILRKYDQTKIVLISALAETFLRKIQKQKMISYHEGTDYFETKVENNSLNEIDEKTKTRLERVQDLVLFRYGSTGLQECLQTVVQVLGLVPVYPVKNVNNFSSSSGTRNGGIFRDCFYVRPNTTMRQLAAMLSVEIEKNYLYAETVGNVRLGEDDIITADNNIVSFRTSS
jgi:ribosome-binding ATPase YchF (GTP1/OBG family)